MAVLTVSGNEITDARRTEGAGVNVAGHSYDGVLSDSSHGIWEARTNLIVNGGAETNVTNITAVNSTLTSDATVAKFGSKCLKIVATSNTLETDASPGGDTGAMRNGMVAGTTYTFSVWVYVPSGGGCALTDVLLQLFDFASAAYQSSNSAFPTAFDTWQRLTVTRTIRAGATEAFCRIHMSNQATGRFFYADGMQLEAASFASPYIHTDGATQTRAAARVQAPASLLGAQGWAAFRFRAGWAAADAFPYELLLDWRTDINNIIQVGFDPATGQFFTTRVIGGTVVRVNSAVQSFAAGTLHTVVAAWTATTLSISVDGVAFVNLSDSRTLTPTGTIDIGGFAATSNFLNGEMLWMMTGKGVVTDADAAALNTNGNTDPTVVSLSGGVLRSAVWPAVTSTADDYTQVGKSDGLPYTIKTLTGKSLAEPYGMTGALGKSLALPYTAKHIVGQEPLTVSGNEITDAVRALGVQGDGLASPDSSYGIWEPATNLITNGGFETDASGYGTEGGAASPPTRDATTSKFGSACGKMVYSASGGNLLRNQGSGGGATAGRPFTFSVWLKVDAALLNSAFTMQISESGGATGESVFATTSINTPGSAGVWVRYTVSGTMVQNDRTNVIVRLIPSANKTGTLWIDGVQLEQSIFATPYVETNGASATRAAGRVRAPVGLLDETQGWVAARVRIGFASAATFPVNQNIFLFAWADSVGERIQLFYNTGTKAWNTRRVTGGNTAQSIVQADSWAAGAMRTLIMAWDATHVYLSVDGGVFVSVANTSIPVLAQTLMDIGTNTAITGVAPAVEAFNGDILWYAMGRGTLSNADAATLHGYGTTPAYVINLPGTPIMLWRADTRATEMPQVSLKQNYVSALAVGKSLAQPYTLRVPLGRSLNLSYGVATPVPIPGKENADTYLDGASAPFGGATPTASDLSIFATFVSTPWSPDPGLEEPQYGRLPYVEAQEAYGQADADVRTTRRATAGWYGTAFEPQEGSYALVSRDGPLADLVGKRLRVSFMESVVPRRTFVYVLAAAPLNDGEDISLARRPYLALERLSRVPVEVVIEEVPKP